MNDQQQSLDSSSTNKLRSSTKKKATPRSPTSVVLDSSSSRGNSSRGSGASCSNHKRPPAELAQQSSADTVLPPPPKSPRKSIKSSIARQQPHSTRPKLQRQKRSRHLTSSPPPTMACDAQQQQRQQPTARRSMFSRRLSSSGRAKSSRGLRNFLEGGDSGNASPPSQPPSRPPNAPLLGNNKKSRGQGDAQRQPAPAAPKRGISRRASARYTSTTPAPPPPPLGRHMERRASTSNLMSSSSSISSWGDCTLSSSTVNKNNNNQSSWAKSHNRAGAGEQGRQRQLRMDGRRAVSQRCMNWHDQQHQRDAMDVDTPAAAPWQRQQQHTAQVEYNGNKNNAVVDVRMMEEATTPVARGKKSMSAAVTASAKALAQNLLDSFLNDDDDDDGADHSSPVQTPPRQRSLLLGNQQQQRQQLRRRASLSLLDCHHHGSSSSLEESINSTMDSPVKESRRLQPPSLLQSNHDPSRRSLFKSNGRSTSEWDLLGGPISSNNTQLYRCKYLSPVKATKQQQRRRNSCSGMPGEDNVMLKESLDDYLQIMNEFKDSFHQRNGGQRYLTGWDDSSIISKLSRSYSSKKEMLEHIKTTKEIYKDQFDEFINIMTEYSSSYHKRQGVEQSYKTGWESEAPSIASSTYRKQDARVMP